jgi:hypothetical protein
MGQHAGRLAPVLTRELRCGDAANRRNAAFAAGELVRAAPQAMAPVLPSLLQVCSFFIYYRECASPQPACCRASMCKQGLQGKKYTAD